MGTEAKFQAWNAFGEYVVSRVDVEKVFPLGHRSLSNKHYLGVKMTEKNRTDADSVNLKEAEKATKASRPWFKKKRFIIPIALIVLGGLSNTTNQTSGTSTENHSVSSSDTKSETAESPATTDEFANETLSEKNSRQKADDYLAYQAFSRKGLISQLVYEGFSKEDAAYGADAVKADWNEQAKLKAESYLSTQSFSAKGLADQLEFEGFDGGQVTYAMSKIVVDWNDQAAKKAQQYLDGQSFSRQGLIDQLVFEGFTQAQAAYGVKKTGL
ncbi:MAG: hypothetical protein RIR34_1147 [Actinomycetota bacterium]